MKQFFKLRKAKLALIRDLELESSINISQYQLLGFSSNRVIKVDTLILQDGHIMKPMIVDYHHTEVMHNKFRYYFDEVNKTRHRILAPSEALNLPIGLIQDIIECGFECGIEVHNDGEPVTYKGICNVMKYEKTEIPVADEEDNNINATFDKVQTLHNDAMKYSLEIEVIIWALKSMKKNNTLTIDAAMQIGYDEWIK